MYDDHLETDLPTSASAIASAIFGALAWISMLTYTINGRVYSILSSGEARLYVGGALAAIAVVCFFISLSSLKTGTHKGWLPAGVGLGIASAVLSIVVPVLLMVALM